MAVFVSISGAVAASIYASVSLAVAVSRRVEGVGRLTPFGFVNIINGCVFAVCSPIRCDPSCHRVISIIVIALFALVVVLVVVLTLIDNALALALALVQGQRAQRCDAMRCDATVAQWATHVSICACLPACCLLLLLFVVALVYLSISLALKCCYEMHLWMLNMFNYGNAALFMRRGVCEDTWKMLKRFTPKRPNINKYRNNGQQKKKKQ